MKNNPHVQDMELVKSNVFYLFYEMMTQSLKTDNVKEGIQTSLSLLRKFLKSGYISLYKKNELGKYINKISDSQMGELSILNTNAVNGLQSLFEANDIIPFHLNFNEELQNIMFIHCRTGNFDYVLSIINYNIEKEMNTSFWERLQEILEIILKRAIIYEKNMQAITTDLLTNLDNRNSYEMRLQSLDETDKKLVVGLFDLFRLKYVNDNYGHVVGDEYIKKVAQILNKYWPKNKMFIKEDGTEFSIDTGHCIYRVGGDEFVLLTTTDDLLQVQEKADKVSLEVEKLIIMNAAQPIIGVNYGIVHHEPGNSIKQTISKADKKLEEDKKKMYVKYGLERRK